MDIKIPIEKYVGGEDGWVVDQMIDARDADLKTLRWFMNMDRYCEDLHITNMMLGDSRPSILEKERQTSLKYYLRECRYLMLLIERKQRVAE